MYSFPYLPPMEFGRLSTKALANVNFRLPPDTARTKATLDGAARRKPRFFLGCAKWGRKEWVGKIYPEKTPEKNYLHHYANHYDTIELNATNYLLYDEKKIRDWLDRTAQNKNFVFCPKAHRAISFIRDSEKKRRFTDEFIHSIRHLGNALGPVFMTINGKFPETSAPEFYTYLASLPSDIQWFIEQRDPAFYANKKFQQTYYDKLAALGMGAVITDTAGRRDVLHTELTIPKAFIRFVGNSLHETDFRRIDAWTRKLEKWTAAGIHEVYFFMHMHDEAYSPELTAYTAERFNSIPGVSLPEIHLL